MQYKNTTQTIDRNVNELSEEDDHSQATASTLGANALATLTRLYSDFNS